MGRHKVVGKSYAFTKTSQMASTGVIFTSTYHTKHLNPWPSSLASHVVNYSHLSSCPGNMELFEGDLSTCVRLTSFSTKPQQSSLGNFQHQYLSELLVHLYSYHFMVKSVSCCCMRGSRLISNPVTNIVFLDIMNNNGKSYVSLFNIRS